MVARMMEKGMKTWVVAVKMMTMVKMMMMVKAMVAEKEVLKKGCCY
jgi:hypothetical protein